MTPAGAEQVLVDWVRTDPFRDADQASVQQAVATAVGCCAPLISADMISSLQLSAASELRLPLTDNLHFKHGE